MFYSLILYNHVQHLSSFFVIIFTKMRILLLFCKENVWHLKFYYRRDIIQVIIFCFGLSYGARKGTEKYERIFLPYAGASALRDTRNT